MGKTPEPITRTDQYLVEIIGLLRSIDQRLKPEKLKLEKPKPAPKKG